MTASPAALVAEVANEYDEEGLLAEQALRRLAWRLARSGKACARCGETKPLGAFGVDVAHRDGLTSRCRACRQRERVSHPRPPTTL